MPLLPGTTLRGRRPAALYNNRERRRGRQDPAYGLHQTHDFGLAATDIDTDGVFPSRSRPVTFRAAIEVTDVAASGIILELGGTTSGVKLAVDGGEIYAAAGNVDEAETDGIDDTFETTLLDTVGARLRIVFAIHPLAGLARVWLNGALVMRIAQATPEAFLSNVWADDNLGSVGAAHSGAASQNRNLVSPINGAPSDFALIEPVRAFDGLPRQFDA